MWRCGGWYQDQPRYCELNVIARVVGDWQPCVCVCSASDDFNAKTENRDQLRIQIAEEIKLQGQGTHLKAIYVCQMIFWCMNETRWRMRARVCVSRAHAHSDTCGFDENRLCAFRDYFFIRNFRSFFLSHSLSLGLEFSFPNRQTATENGVTCDMSSLFYKRTRSGRQTNKERKTGTSGTHVCADAYREQCVHIGWQHSFLANFVRAPCVCVSVSER